MFCTHKKKMMIFFGYLAPRCVGYLAGTLWFLGDDSSYYMQDSCPILCGTVRGNTHPSYDVLFQGMVQEFKQDRITVEEVRLFPHYDCQITSISCDLGPELAFIPQWDGTVIASLQDSYIVPDRHWVLLSPLTSYNNIEFLLGQWFPTFYSPRTPKEIQPETIQRIFIFQR